jgi:ligand-binding sensor domain-containing protein
MLVAAIGLARHASAIERVRFRSFSTELGLAQSTVSDLAVDSFGFLWLATQDGLSRFDGRRFDNFQKHEDPSRGLKDNFLLALASDARGALYIASQSPTLTRFDLFSERFSHFDLASVLQARDDFVVSLRWLDERRLALSTRRSGVLIFDAEERRLLPQPEVLKAAGTRVLLRLNEQCWLAQGSSMLLADTHFRSVRTVLTLANQVPGALIKRRTGGFLLGTNSVGVIALDEQYRRLDEFSLASAAPRQLSDNYVRTLLEDRQGQI